MDAVYRSRALMPALLPPVDQAALCGCQVRCGKRQSIPSSNIDSCAGVSATFPPGALGQTNRPPSRRLLNIAESNDIPHTDRNLSLLSIDGTRCMVGD
jgi:hypothetical protein